MAIMMLTLDCSVKRRPHCSVGHQRSFFFFFGSRDKRVQSGAAGIDRPMTCRCYPLIIVTYFDEENVIFFADDGSVAVMRQDPACCYCCCTASGDFETRFFFSFFGLGGRILKGQVSYDVSCEFHLLSCV